jgi:hypothetical protein
VPRPAPALHSLQLQGVRAWGSLRPTCWGGGCGSSPAALHSSPLRDGLAAAASSLPPLLPAPHLSPSPSAPLASFAGDRVGRLRN